MVDNNDCRNAGAMEESNQKLHEDEDDEFLDGSHSNKNVAGQHLDRHHNQNQLLQQDANQAEDLLSGPSSAVAAPSGGDPAAATPAITKELLQVEVELRLLEALEIYHPAKLQGIHRHFILYGLMEYLERRLNHHFSSDEILELLDHFYNLDLLKQDEEESELLSHEEDFSLPACILSIKEELKENS